MRLALVIGGLLILGLPFAFVSCGGGEDEAVTEETTFRVVRGDLKITLTESGSLEARHKTNVRPEIRRGEKIISLVEEGKTVHKGDVLAELDKTAIEEDIERFEDQIIQYETELKNARTELDIQKQTNESELDNAKLTLEVAEMAKKRYEQGELEQTLEDLDFQVEQTKAKLEQAEYRYKSIPDLLQKKFVTEVEAREKELAVEEARGKHQAALRARDLFLKYTKEMELKQKSADVTEARRELSRVQARAEARLASKLAVVRQKERQYEVANSKLEEAKEEIGFLTIIAPQDGIVIYGGKTDRWGNVEDSVKVGETAYPGRTLIELPDLTQMDVHLQIHQADVTKVKTGQKAIVTIPGRRNAVFEATVADIGSVAQSRSWRDPIKRFKVVLEIAQRVEGLRSGVTVEAEIDVGAIKDVLYIPLQAATMSGGSYFVYAKTAAGIEKTPVQLGRANEQYVEVKEGLSEGDEVLLVTPQVVEGESKNGNGNGGGTANGNGGSDAKTPTGRPAPTGGTGNRMPGRSSGGGRPGR